MNKTEFVDALRRSLGKLPSYEVEQSIAFYSEMIDDRVEDGMSEQDAVAALGPVGAIAAQIIAETPAIPKAIAKANTGSRTLNIVLLVVFSPIWVPIALALIVTAFSIYLSIWAVIVALWITVAALLLCGPIGIVGFVWCLGTGYPLTATYLLGCGLAGAGVGLFAWFGVLAASKGLFNLTRQFARWIKGLFVKRAKSDENAGTTYAAASGMPVGVGAPPAPPSAYPAPPYCLPGSALRPRLSEHDDRALPSCPRAPERDAAFRSEHGHRALPVHARHAGARGLKLERSAEP